MFAAAWGVRSHDRAQALRALMPIAVGHATSVSLVAAAVALGLSMDRIVLQALAGGLLVAVATVHLLGRTPRRARAPARHAGLALWSFMMSTAHGTGLMLVPALIPLCMGDAAAREITASASLALALAAVGVHTAAMLTVTGVIATGACQGFVAGAHLLQSLRASRLKPCMLLFSVLCLNVVGCAVELVGEGRRGGQREAQRRVIHRQPAGGAAGAFVHKSTALWFCLRRLRAKPVMPLSHEFVCEPEVNAQRRLVP
jgi:hypothetical protein